ncbi:cysteine synthase [Streptomyces griseoflavus Tu4000]|uniref:Cysteine synthase n=1 Tax=Streptomyces griseoflavus Tu4000 TaxID=467200 RepID=D9XKV5_9ACTN|nr:cysteine synthase [Streptomyces griseoflavus Tu4000]
MNAANCCRGHRWWSPPRAPSASDSPSPARRSGTRSSWWATANWNRRCGSYSGRTGCGWRSWTGPAPRGGWQAARLARLRELLGGLPDAYWPDQYNNPDNTSGYASLAAELAAQLDHLDVLVCSVGTGGHSAGIIGPLRRHWPALRLIGVDSTGSTIFGQPARPRLMRGLGSSIHPRNVAYDAFDEVHWLGPAEAVDGCRRLARGSFVSGGWSTGAVARVAAWAARVHSGAVVATVFPDGPHRYLGTVYDDDFTTAHGVDPDAAATRPVQIPHPCAAEATGWARCTRVTDPLETAPGGTS